MTTTEEHLPEITTACPSWCTLEPGHEYDSIHDDGRHSRGHGGPKFGPYLDAGADEFSDAPGVLLHVVELYVEDGAGLSMRQLLQLSHDALAAWDWLEARETEAGR